MAIHQLIKRLGGFLQPIQLIILLIMTNKLNGFLAYKCLIFGKQVIEKNFIVDTKVDGSHVYDWMRGTDSNCRCTWLMRPVW